MTLIRRRPSTTTFSMAPAAPRMPWRMRAPSKAGPAAVEAAQSFPSAESTISPLVPMSTNNVGSAASIMPVAKTPGHRVAADETADDRQNPRAAAGMNAQAELRGAEPRDCGRPPERTAPRPRELASTPQSNCCMVVLPASVSS